MPDYGGRGDIETEIARFMVREMSAIRRQVESDLLAAGMDISKTQIPSAEYWSNLSSRIEALMRGKLEDVYISAAEQFMDSVSYGLDHDMLTASARAWSSQAAMNLVTQMNDTSKRQVLETVDKFFADSMTNAQLRESLEKIFSPRRAELVAITEVTRAAVEGGERIAADLRSKGVQLVAIWETLVDERVCPICGPRHGTKQGDSWMFPPPAHPKCRCFINYEVLAVGETVMKTLPKIRVGMIIRIKVAA